MKIVSQVFSTDPDYYADIACAVVDITPEVARKVLERRKAFLALKETDKEALCSEFWDNTPDFIKDDGVDADFDYPDEWREAKEEESFGEPARVEGAKIIIYDDGCVWSASPKHTSIYVSTAKIAYSDIESFV